MCLVYGYVCKIKRNTLTHNKFITNYARTVYIHVIYNTLSGEKVNHALADIHTYVHIGCVKSDPTNLSSPIRIHS